MEEALGMEQTPETVSLQGAGASATFEGALSSPVVEKMYGESPKFIAGIIRNHLKSRAEPYRLLDVGSFQGELLNKILAELKGDYAFHTIGLDTDEKALSANEISDETMLGDATHIPLADKSVDLAIARYVLQWNSAERQKLILKELGRVCRQFFIIQHVGATRQDILEWQERMHQLVFGGVPKVSRPEGYFSSPEEIETWMTEQGLNFQTLQDRTVEGASLLYLEKYQLSAEELQEVKNILGDKDHIQQTTWLVRGGE